MGVQCAMGSDTRNPFGFRIRIRNGMESSFFLQGRSTSAHPGVCKTCIPFCTVRLDMHSCSMLTSALSHLMQVAQQGCKQ